tara:strand:- start:73 stop:315 length:243 start_codon:yes stop_codon:yes gene_type:complete
MPKFYVEIFRNTRETTSIVVEGKDRAEAKARADKYWKGQERASYIQDHRWDYVDATVDLDSVEAYDQAPDDAEVDDLVFE